MRRFNKKSFVLIALIYIALFIKLGCSERSGPSDIFSIPGEETLVSGDSIPPQQINDAFFEYDGDLTLHWTAPYDDSPVEAVSGYQIRYSYSFLDSNFFWELAEPVPDPPDTASAPGTPEHYALTDFQRGKKISAAIRSEDEGGNLSALSNIASLDIPGYLFEGTCIELDGTPVSDLLVAVTIQTAEYIRYDTVLTDVNGEFLLEDLPAEDATLSLEITNGQSGGDYHRMIPTYDLDSDYDEEFIMITVDTDLISPYYDTILGLAIILHHAGFDQYCNVAPDCDNPYALRKWQSIPVDVYVPQSVMDTYGADNIQDGIAMWNDVWQQSFGTDLFNLIISSALPDTGIYFRPTGSSGGCAWHGRDEQSPSGYPILEHVYLYCCPTNPVIVAHELGHGLPWGHSVDYDNHLMYGGAATAQAPLSEDEAKAAVLLYSLPDETDLSMYDISAP